MHLAPTPARPFYPPPLTHLILCCLDGRPVLGQHHGQGEEEHEQPVAHVPKHDSEEEGEGDDGVGRCGRGAVRSADPAAKCASCRRRHGGLGPDSGQHLIPTSSETQCGQQDTPQARCGPWPAGLQPRTIIHFPKAALIPILQVRQLRLRGARTLTEVSESDPKPRPLLLQGLGSMPSNSTPCWLLCKLHQGMPG